MKSRRIIFCLSLLLMGLILPESLFGQHPLEMKFNQIANSISGDLGISVLHIESGEGISMNGNKRFPMQSVYKFPIAMVMLREIDKGNFSLQDTVEIDKSEYIPKAGHSPIRNKYPDGVSMTIQQVLEYNTSHSDGTACDVLLRLLGGTKKVQKAVRNLGVKNIAIATTEMIQVANDEIQYRNWSTPKAMSQLFKIFHEGTLLSEHSQALLLKHMSISNKWFDRRLKGLLPSDTPLVHKTGTARTYKGLTRATNDAGIITLPNGNHIIVSVFISDSYASQSDREMAIAKAAKEAYDYWAQ